MPQRGHCRASRSQPPQLHPKDNRFRHNRKYGDALSWGPRLRDNRMRSCRQPS
ncbi:uncharacterized protein BDV17DRAFT_252789 [Aspergillus undulatus]|uniref:uncharacterized protein n=1 Tax=Aspergillus undulatus TaxID=1810928 RepID=UPI003CCE015A